MVHSEGSVAKNCEGDKMWGEGLDFCQWEGGGRRWNSRRPKKKRFWGRINIGTYYFGGETNSKKGRNPYYVEKEERARTGKKGEQKSFIWRGEGGKEKKCKKKGILSQRVREGILGEG